MTKLTGTEALDEVRRPAENPHAFRGMGPLLALALFVLLSVVLAPTVAPERIVEVESSTPTTTTGASTTATTAGTATTAVPATTATTAVAP